MLHTSLQQCMTGGKLFKVVHEVLMGMFPETHSHASKSRPWYELPPRVQGGAHHGSRLPHHPPHRLQVPPSLHHLTPPIQQHKQSADKRDVGPDRRL